MTGLLSHCAPFVAPATIAAIIRVESGNERFAVNVNGVGRFDPRTLAAAHAIAERFIAAGKRVDLGLMQIDSGNLPGVGKTVSEILHPCTNIRTGAQILAKDYLAAERAVGPGQTALEKALSAYNTGNFYSGLRNGYVTKIYRQNLASGQSSSAMTVYPANSSMRKQTSRQTMTIYVRGSK